MQTEIDGTLHLRGLLDYYRSIDCWCGEDFNGVVGSYIRWAGDPDDPESLDAIDGDTFGALARTARLTAEERRLGLQADIDRLLRSTCDEETRLGAVVGAGGHDLLEFSDFWMPTGDGCESPFPATLFLVLARRYAQESESERGVFDPVAAKAILEVAERDAARLTDVR